MMSKPEWVLEYKATDAYRIPDVSPESLHSLVKTFKTPGSSNFEKYYLYNSVSAGGEKCDEECKTAQICGITEVDFENEGGIPKNKLMVVDTEKAMNNIDPGDTSGDVLAILQEQLESRNKTTVVVESTVLIIFNIVALVGNAILCFIPYGNPKLRSSTTMLIVALACTDLLTTANVMPLTIDAVINSRRRFSDTNIDQRQKHFILIGRLLISQGAMNHE
ncbi:hypothetical protein pdam_00011977 [Pocillopora damicornis]|uniref:Sphingomyelin phosphodiesterase C-terminal domain-containing protein n=1 Tax=Pocillopora damicornis TaxID=46731 RepID=A0A3M6UL00_POCDA|nr:hypothetical protein pdam_00011977 [Pocillopora damicornis]